MKYFFFFIIISTANISYSELLKPQADLLPEEVISIQLTALQNNNYPYINFGIEQGFFKESLVCNLDSSITNLSKEDLIKELQQQTVSCKDVSFRIFGLSLATINTIISLILSVITIKLFLNYGKNE